MKKIAILASFNVDLFKRDFEKYLKAKYDYQFELFWSPYGRYSQMIVDVESPFYTFNPDIVIVHLEIESIAGNKYYDLLSLNRSDWGEYLNGIKETLRNTVVRILTVLPQVKIVLENFISRDKPILGFLDLNITNSEFYLQAELNLYLAELVEEFMDRIVINDYSNLVASWGKKNWFDTRMYHLAKQSISYARFYDLAKHYCDMLELIIKTRKKCVVLDLDNTLWGGVIGQDGIDNIQLGGPGAGEAYMHFQKYLLNLYRQGIFLTICSKNNYDDAIEVIEKHPDMVLRKNYFASIKVNWKSKDVNIKEIADELNIGLDSIVFVDDNPAECELVKMKIPEIDIIHVKGDPDNYIALLQENIGLNSLHLTDEDYTRNTMIIQNIQRKEFKSSFSNLDEYYRSLEMKGYLAVNNRMHIGRVSQLTQKTNQFTLTTRRYSSDEIEKFIDDGGRVYSLRLTDKFGDNGIIAVAIVKCEESKWVIDTFLMSCRVIGRRAEYLLMQSIINDAEKHGASFIVAEYIPTLKNKPAAEFLPEAGFLKKSEYLYEKYLPCSELKYFIELIME